MVNSDPDFCVAAPAFGSRRFGGLLVRRPVWLPSWRGWILLLALIGLAGFGGVRTVHRFLSANAPVGADVLVIEAWVPDYVLKDGLELAAARNCRLVLLTGGTVKGEPNPEPGDTYPRMAEQRIRRFGGNMDRIRMVEAITPTRDRTYASAVAVREWMIREKVDVSKIDLLTMGAHARRSRLLFEKALGPDVEVGILSIPDREYDAAHWWLYSEGVKEVLSEGAAYFYARFLFYPD